MQQAWQPNMVKTHREPQRAVCTAVIKHYECQKGACKNRCGGDCFFGRLLTGGRVCYSFAYRNYGRDCCPKCLDHNALYQCMECDDVSCYMCCFTVAA
ncbi:unnamed protein product [Adineta steineri]|uniref:Uncharacterized protein n=1 Tax=Adineta steineri TaxID=433720 RepID=A0A819X1V6_9BILA|nr:unnamed protein product [Adineta steineri]